MGNIHYAWILYFVNVKVIDHLGMFDIGLFVYWRDIMSWGIWRRFLYNIVCRWSMQPSKLAARMLAIAYGFHTWFNLPIIACYFNVSMATQSIVQGFIFRTASLWGIHIGKTTQYNIITNLWLYMYNMCIHIHIHICHAHIYIYVYNMYTVHPVGIDHAMAWVGRLFKWRHVGWGIIDIHGFCYWLMNKDGASPIPLQRLFCW